MKNKMEDLRNHLFATLEALQDDENPMELERAKTIAQVASVIVSSAKVEATVMANTGSIGTGFIPVVDGPKAPLRLD
jgi:phosphoribosylaminoimidazole (AIR) synthetase